MQIMALFVHGGIREPPNILIHIQLPVQFSVLFISSLVQVLAQLHLMLWDRWLREHTGF